MNATRLYRAATITAVMFLADLAALYIADLAALYIADLASIPLPF